MWTLKQFSVFGWDERESIQLSVYLVSTFSGPLLQDVASVRPRHSQRWQLILHTGDFVHDSHWANQGREGLKDGNWMYGVLWGMMWLMTYDMIVVNPCADSFLFAIGFSRLACAWIIAVEHKCTHAAVYTIPFHDGPGALCIRLYPFMVMFSSISWPTDPTEAKVCRSTCSPLLLLLIWTLAWCNSWPSRLSVSKLLHFEAIASTEVDLYQEDWWLKLSTRWWSEMHEDFGIAGSPADQPPDSWFWRGELKELEPFKEPGTGADCDWEENSWNWPIKGSISHAESSDVEWLFW